ncbi:PQQ-like beta-propeller repeat protein [bacterium]|nr:PQQ-like beta-propeller repeat protein [bacterium]
MKSSPAIGKNGVIYLASDMQTDNIVFALNQDGMVQWTYNIKIGVMGSIVSSPAVSSEGTIFIGSGDFNLYALNPDGTLKWTYPTESWIASSPVISDEGDIYFGSGYKVYGLYSGGSLKWGYETGGIIHSSPAIGSDGTIYIGSCDGKLYALNHEDGSLCWAYPAGDKILSSPAVGADGTIYFGNGGYGLSGRLYALYPDGSLKWSYQTGGNVYSSPAVASDGTIYAGNSNADSAYGANQGNQVFAVNPGDGSVKWAYPVGDGDENSIFSSPAIGSDGTVYIGCDNGKVYALTSDGGLKWSYQTQGEVSSSPAIGSDGTVYIGSCDGKIYAFGPVTITVYPGLNTICIPLGAEETYPNASSLWNQFINQNHEIIKIQAFSSNFSKWLTFGQPSPGTIIGEDFSLTGGMTILVYTNQTEIKDIDLTFAQNQPAPPVQSLPEFSPGLNLINLPSYLFGGDNNSQTSEEKWPESQDLWQRFEQEKNKPISFMSLNSQQGKWQSKYPFFGRLAGSESNIGKRGYLVFME